MIIDRDDRAVFTHQLQQRRRRGRPCAAVPSISTTVRLPQPLFDACCRVALASGRSLPDVVREAVKASIEASDARQFPSSTIQGAARAW